MNNFLPVIFFFGIILYFTPVIVATNRKHRNAGAIAVLNLFLGWTLVGWVAALVWSFTDNCEVQKSF